MARRVEEIKRVRRNMNETQPTTTEETIRRAMTDEDYEEEYYDVGESLPDEQGLNAASGVLALALLALAIYLVWAALQ